MKSIIAFIAILIFMTACGIKEEKYETKDLTQWMDKTIEKAMMDNDIPAFSIGVIYKGELLMSKGYGTKSRETKSKVDENTRYQIASQSKTFTGIIAKNLINEGKLSLDASIDRYLADILRPEAKERFSTVQLNHLLQHTAGIPSGYCKPYREREEGGYWTKGYTEEELILDLNTMELDFESGSKWNYSNSGYAVLGYICEQVSGMSYEKLLQKYVTHPYKMTNTLVTLTATQKADLPTPYRKDDRTIANKINVMGKTAPASSIYSNVVDLSSFALAQINAYSKGNQNNPLILTENPAQMNEKLFYGYGLIMQDSPEEGKRYGHGGDADGFACGYMFSAENDMALVTLSNSGGAWFAELEQMIFKRLLDYELKRPLSSQKKSLAKEVRSKIQKEGIKAGLMFYEANKNVEQYEVTEAHFNSLGYQLLGKKKIDDAIAIFEINVKAFPNSSNVYDSLGEAYMKKGNKELAIKNYEKSLALDASNDNAKKMLEELK